MTATYQRRRVSVEDGLSRRHVLLHPVESVRFGVHLDHLDFFGFQSSDSLLDGIGRGQLGVLVHGQRFELGVRLDQGRKQFFRVSRHLVLIEFVIDVVREVKRSQAR